MGPKPGFRVWGIQAGTSKFLCPSLALHCEVNYGVLSLYRRGCKDYMGRLKGGYFGL